MSWLTDLTSKAETFLTKIDQSAAEKFNENSLEAPSVKHSIKQYDVSDVETHVQATNHISHSPPATNQIKKPFPSINHQAPLITKCHSADGKISTQTSADHPERNKSASSKKQDEMLFEFLNNTNPAMKSKSKSSTPVRMSPVQTGTPLSSRSHSPSVEINLEQNDDTTDVLTSVKVEEPVVQHVEHKAQIPDELARQREDQISNVQLENQLLKNEMQSLNEELSTTLSRLKEKQEECEEYKLRYENRRNQQNEDYGRICSEYENKEADFGEALKAKDSQLAVLRVRIQEVDGELKEKVKSLADLQTQNERLLKDHNDASGVQNVALDSVREKLEEAQSQLDNVQEENEAMKSELMIAQEKLVNEQQQYAETIKQLEARHNQGKDKFREYEMKVRHAEDDAHNASKQLNDYKEKAARILQAKEKLINSLKQGATTELPPMLMVELEEVKQERDSLYEEYNQYKCETQQLRTEYQEFEILHNTDSEDNQQKLEGLTLSLQDESTRRQHAEEDIKRYMQELQLNKEELHKMRKGQVAQNQQYEGEIKKLQNQINVKHNISSSQEELENRIRTLTDSLIHKQTVVETLSTEKNSLVLQLERLEKQYYDIQKSFDKRNKERNSNDIEDLDGDGRVTSMNSIMPSQIVRNRRWKSTVNEIDKFSIRLGVFLRRYPAARLMVLIYMLFLHVWVTFVLLTYTPEIHSQEPHG